jgi:uncharacterized phiE125 gp8 family phage protein
MLRPDFIPSYPPTNAIVPLDDMRLHVRRDDNDDDEAILAAEKAAVRHLEKLTGRLMPARSAKLRLSRLPCGKSPIDLPGGHVQSIDSVSFDGASQDAADFTVAGNGPARLIPGEEWPFFTDQEKYNVEITYTVGFAAVPEDLKAAIKLLAAHLYENREAVVIGESAITLPMAVETIAGLHRIRPR